jgi:hypothetical protein
MGSSIIATLIAMAMLAGCTDWREGDETVEACMKRHALKVGAVDPLADDPGIWVPAYTYDITKLENASAFGKEVRKRGGTYRFVGSTEGSKPDDGIMQRERDRLEDTSATAAGAVIGVTDPSLYKVRGKPSLYRDLLRQGCEGQRAGMRLVSMSFYREDALADGELPLPEMTATQRREIIDKFNKPLIKDPLP